MIIAVTGTPGTGKTSVSRELAEFLDYEYVDVNEFSKRSDVEAERDEERDTLAVDVDSLVAAIEGEVAEDAVLDGHLSHYFPADLTVVLRCSPDELRARLEEKGWDGEKVEENVEAEVLDLILQQAVGKRDRVMEVDTTGEKAEAVAVTVAGVIEEGSIPSHHRPGQIQWDVEG